VEVFVLAASAPFSCRQVRFFALLDDDGPDAHQPLHALPGSMKFKPVDSPAHADLVKRISGEGPRNEASGSSLLARDSAWQAVANRQFCSVKACGVFMSEDDHGTLVGGEIGKLRGMEHAKLRRFLMREGQPPRQVSTIHSRRGQ